jgi:hypothetical protein
MRIAIDVAAAGVFYRSLAVRYLNHRFMCYEQTARRIGFCQVNSHENYLGECTQ